MNSISLRHVARFVLVAGLLLSATSACSVVMASRQPAQKDLGVLDVGTPRAQVLAELGGPVWTGEKDGMRADLFTIRQGSHKAVKVSRAVFHAVADVFTLGLWEVVGTPVELIFDGTDLKIEVTYDGADRVAAARVNNEVWRTAELAAPAGAAR